MSFAFELVTKDAKRETIVRTNDASELLHHMAASLERGRMPAARVNEAPYSGARGEIEIGVEGGPQVCFRVL